MKPNIPALTVTAISILLFCHLPSFGQQAPSSSDNKKIAITYFNEVVNTKKLNRMGDFFASDYVWHQMNGTDTRSSQDSSHRATLRWLFTAVPDIHYSIDQVIAEGVMVTAITTATGTARSEMFGLPAAQKKVSFKQVFLFKFADKKITDEWEVVDSADLMEDLKK